MVKKVLKWLGAVAVVLVIGITSVSTYNLWQDQTIDVAGLECRVDLESTRKGEFTPPEKAEFFYTVLQATRDRRDKIHSILNFDTEKESPRYFVSRYSGGDTTITPDNMRFDTDAIKDEDKLLISIDRKKLHLMTVQPRVGGGEYIFIHLNTSARWTEFSDTALPKEPAPITPWARANANENRHVKLASCNAADPIIVRAAAKKRYMERLSGNQI